MITLRAAQMAELDRIFVLRFVEEIVQHIPHYAPRLYQIVGEAGIREAVRDGVQRAASYGFTNRGPSRLFVEMQFSLGTAFDTDPLLPWASELLHDRAAGQMLRATRLHQCVTAYLDDVTGPRGEHALAALRALTAADPLRQLSSGTRDSILSAFWLVHPRKARAAGEAALLHLIRAGCGEADRLSLGGIGRALICCLMFGFGHGVLHDPLYAWVGNTLRHNTTGDPSVRAERLYRKTMLYVARVRDYFASDEM